MRPFGEMNVFVALTVLMVSQVSLNTKPFQLVYFEYVQLIWQFYFSEGIKNSQTAAVSCGSLSREILVMNWCLKPPICFSFMYGKLTMCQAPWKVLSMRSKQHYFCLKRSRFEKRWLDSSPIGSSEAVTWCSPVILYWLHLPMLLRFPCFSEWLVVSGNHRYRDGRRCSP